MSQSKIRRYVKHGTFPQLSVFESIARLGSFTRAAEELYMAQPTVSVQIKKLTETVGLPLFEQIGKRVHVTEAGRHLYTACQRIFQGLSNLEDTFSDIRGLKCGQLRLAASATGTYFVPRLLAAFAQRYPNVEASLQIHHREGLIERLGNNEDDLYIFANPPQDSNLMTQMIQPNPMVVLARADHPLAGETNISFERFAQEPFLMREPGSGTRMVVQQLFETHGVTPWTRMELATNEAIVETILAGLGVSILSRYTPGLDTEQTQLVTLDVQGFPLKRHWHFVYPAGKQLSLVARTFMNFVRIDAKQRISDHPAQDGHTR